MLAMASRQRASVPPFVLAAFVYLRLRYISVTSANLVLSGGFHPDPPHVGTPACETQAT
jgi:hypothetical protein